MIVTIWLALAPFVLGVNRLQKFETAQEACARATSDIVYKLEYEKIDRKTCCALAYSTDKYREECMREGDFSCPAGGEFLTAMQCVSAPSFTVKKL